MVEPNYRIKKAFLAAPGQVQLQVLKDELRQRQIEPGGGVSPYEVSLHFTFLSLCSR